jgi:hypothetical protein
VKERRPVDITSHDDVYVFGVLLLGIFAISAIVLTVVLLASAAARVVH